MKKLNHLMTYESYLIEEEFNPLKKDDWKAVGDSIRKGAGFSTPEEEIEEGKERVLSHVKRREVYLKLKSSDPEKANEYLRFWANHGLNATPYWDDEKRKFVDRSSYDYNTGVGGRKWN